MTMMHISRDPMNKGQFDKVLAGIGWRREGDAASSLHERNGVIGGIDKAKLANGKEHILFETSCGARIDDLLEAVGCVSEHDDGFHALVGLGDED